MKDSLKGAKLIINLPCCVLDVVPGDRHAGSSRSLLIGWFEKPLCHDGWG